MSFAALDQEFLDELIDGDKEFAVELFETYQESAVEALAEARRLLDSGSTDELFRPFHTLKGASASVGLLGVQAYSKELEFSAREGRIESCRERIPELEAGLETANQVLKNFLESLSE